MNPFAVAALLLVVAVASRKKKPRGEGSEVITPVTPPGELPQTPPEVPPLPEVAPWFTDDVAAREAKLLELVEAKQHDPIEWAVVVSVDGDGNRAEIPVMADALMFNGLRVTMTYKTAQQAADAMGLVMATPWVVGLVSEQATRRGTYTAPQPPSTSRARTVETSDDVTRKIGNTGGLAVNASKWWVISRAIIDRNKLGASINHGLFNGPWEPVQNVGTWHDNLDHVDNTQGGRWMGARSRVTPAGGEPFEIDTAELVTSDQWGHLANGSRNHIQGRQVGEGPLPWSRHPGVPPQQIAEGS